MYNVYSPPISSNINLYTFEEDLLEMASLKVTLVLVVVVMMVSAVFGHHDHSPAPAPSPHSGGASYSSAAVASSLAFSLLALINW